MKRLSLSFCIILLFQIFSSSIAWCASHSPIGTWVTIDDKTNRPRSEVKIWESYGKLYGKVIKVYPMPGDKGICSKCPGAFKNKPIKGLNILWGLKSSGGNVWSGGEILDPKSGKIYNLKITVAENGRTLDVRGFVGISLLGRTQVWRRK